MYLSEELSVKIADAPSSQLNRRICLLGLNQPAFQKREVAIGNKEGGDRFCKDVCSYLIEVSIGFFVSQISQIVQGLEAIAF